jgi:hypothetical protein
MKIGKHLRWFADDVVKWSGDQGDDWRSTFPRTALGRGRGLREPVFKGPGRLDWQIVDQLRGPFDSKGGRVALVEGMGRSHLVAVGDKHEIEGVAGTVDGLTQEYSVSRRSTNMGRNA